MEEPLPRMSKPLHSHIHNQNEYFCYFKRLHIQHIYKAYKYIGFLPACIFLYHVCLVSMEARGGIGYTGTEVTVEATVCVLGIDSGWSGRGALSQSHLSSPKVNHFIFVNILNQCYTIETSLASFKVCVVCFWYSRVKPRLYSWPYTKCSYH